MGVKIELSNLFLPESTNKTIIIEGAGGLLVPLNDTNYVVDLIKHLIAKLYWFREII
jgi:dethiobiotin synthetase